MEKEMATHSSILAWESHGQRSLVGCSPYGHKRVRHNLATEQQQLFVFIIFYLFIKNKVKWYIIFSKYMSNRQLKTMKMEKM